MNAIGNAERGGAVHESVTKRTVPDDYEPASRCVRSRQGVEGNGQTLEVVRGIQATDKDGDALIVRDTQSVPQAQISARVESLGIDAVGVHLDSRQHIADTGQGRMRGVIRRADEDAIRVRHDPWKHEPGVQSEERTSDAVRNGVHVVRKHERLSRLQPLLDEHRLGAAEEGIVQMNEVEPAELCEERWREGRVADAQRRRQPVHEGRIVG
jgi:hypothetical protein